MSEEPQALWADPVRCTPGPWHWENMPRELIKPNHNALYEPYDPGGNLGKLVGANGEEVLWIGNDEQYYPTEGNEPNAQDAAMIAAAPEMYAILKELEFSVQNYGHGADYDHCPICLHAPDAHSESCRLAALLKRARGES